MPPIDDLDAMVEELNQKDNFSKFVITMRKKFKESLSKVWAAAHQFKLFFVALNKT